mmetsp:Transcript_2857/g.8857  ORF Transcript_2857/g.8857 Transcript_2857/m.8857 type:complete len:208 (+) Transcript_2857:791-1414(+)
MQHGRDRALPAERDERVRHAHPVRSVGGRAVLRLLKHQGLFVAPRGARVLGCGRGPCCLDGLQHGGQRQVSGRLDERLPAAAARPARRRHPRAHLRRRPGLHLQLAGQQGVDARAAVGGQGGVQWRVRSAVVRARRHRPFAARGGCAHRQGPHVPPRVRRGPHGAHGPARRVARHARSVPCRQTRMNAPGHCRLRPLCADMRQPGRN